MRTKTWLCVVAALAVLLSVCPSPSYASVRGEEKIRVLVLDGVKTLNVRNGHSLTEVSWVSAGDVRVNGKPAKRLPMRFYPGSGLIQLNGYQYRGKIEVFGTGSGLMVVDELPLEEYLVGLINNEISTNWPEDAIKAQAVIARTYALYRKNNGASSIYDIESTVLGQVYKGTVTEDAAAEKAVRGCAGEVLTYNGELALTVYHSNAGGLTDSSEDVWSRYNPYLVSRPSPYDIEAPRLYWDFVVPEEVLGKMLRDAGHTIGVPEEITIDELTPGGRAKRLIIRDREGRSIMLGGEALRKILGYDVLRSTVMKVRRYYGFFVFQGKGWGHGVGLSQWGAKGMAENGYSYREILDHYYPGTALTKAY